jgi:hypothetical protein
MPPLLSWQAAKVAFVKHFQRGDYLDGRRLFYAQCNQTSGETIQEFSRRFQTLATQLHYPDSDTQTTYHYLEGLHRYIQQKLITYKITMRTVGGNPTWDFISLATTINLAITIGTEAIYTQHPPTQPNLPLHLQRSALANPSSKHGMPTNNNKSKTTDHHPSVASTLRVPMVNRKRTNSYVEEKKCQYHPNSTSHTTEECRTKGERPRETGAITPTSKSSIPVPVRPQVPIVTTTTRVKPSTSSSPGIQCYRCNQYGHMSRECPENPKSKFKAFNSISASKPGNSGNFNPARSGQPIAPPLKRARLAHVSSNVNPTELTLEPLSVAIPSSTIETPLRTE